MIQKLEYSSRSTGFPDLRTLSKSSRLVTSSPLVLVTNWKVARSANVETAIAIVHEGFSNRHAAIETSKIDSNPTNKKE